MDDNERSIHRTWQDPRVAASKARTMSGLDYLSAVKNGDIASAPIGILLDLHFHVVEKGRIVVAGRPQEQHYNPIGLVHGGYLSTMLDSAMGCAVHTELDAGVGYSTVSLQVSFVKAVGVGTSKLFAEGRVVHLGKRQATAEGYLRDHDGVLYAHATTVCMILG